MFLARTDKTNFGAGEVSPILKVAEDLQRHRAGVEICENMVTLIEAVLTRRPGTRFVAPLRNENETGVMLPFRYSGNDYYMLLFNGGKMRLGRDGGIAEISPGVPFELSVPWIEADWPKLRAAPSGNAITVVAGENNRPKVITRNNTLDWSIAEYDPKNGPVDTRNLEKTITIHASAIAGDIDLVGFGNPFKPEWVGGIMRLDEQDQSTVPVWSAFEDFNVAEDGGMATATALIGDMSNPGNAFDNNAGTFASKTGTTFAIGRTFEPRFKPNKAYISMTPALADSGGVYTVKLRGLMGTTPPVNYATDGSELGVTTFQASVGEEAQTIISQEPLGQFFNHIWIYGEITGHSPSGPVGLQVSEVVIWRITTVESHGLPLLRRWQANTYEARSGGTSGAEPPTHIEGDWKAGNRTIPGTSSTPSSTQAGVIWRFLHDGGGYVRVNSVTDGNTATGTVLTRLPDSVVGSGTYRFWPPAWGPGRWPEIIQTFKQRFGFFRGNVYWYTQPASRDSFKFTADAESGITRRLIGNSGSLVDIMWAIGKAGVLLGTRDGEWVTRAQRPTEPFAANNIDDDPDTEEGSCPQIPVLVDAGVVFIGRSRDRLHFVQFNKLAEQLTVQEISVASRHIWRRNAIKMAWQRDPHRILWIILEDGTLASMTFMPDEKIAAAARHPMANCFIEDIAALSTLDDGKAQVWLQTRRVIEDETRRYYEILTDFFVPRDKTNPTAEGAWFVDCGLRYAGPPATVISGGEHLEGRTVAVFADGAQQTDKQVRDGQFTLDRPASEVVFGERIIARVRDLPRGASNPTGTSKGLPQRASHVQVSWYESVGGHVTINDSLPEPLSETGALDYGAPIPLETRTGHFWIASETQEEVVTELTFDHAFPVTLMGLVVGNLVEEETA